MAYLHADRVKETTTTTGTGTYSLAGAAAGFRTFVAGYGTANRCTYCVENGTNWEINEGTITDAAPDTLTRDRFLVSSTGSAISWAAGSKNVFGVYAAADRNPRTRKLTADHSISSTVGTEVTGLELANVQPGTYIFQYYLICQSATITVGLGLSLNFTGTVARTVISRFQSSTATTTATGVMDNISNNLTGSFPELWCTTIFSTIGPNMLNTGVAVVNTDCLVIIEGVIEVTAAGALELWHSSETATATSVESGSSVMLTRIDG